MLTITLRAQTLVEKASLHMFKAMVEHAIKTADDSDHVKVGADIPAGEYLITGVALMPGSPDDELTITVSPK